MTESKAKELDKQEQREIASEPVPVPAENPAKILSNPSEDDLDRVVREQQELLDARKAKEAEEEAKAGKGFLYTANIAFKHFIKIKAKSKEEALQMIGKITLGQFLEKTKIRIDQELKL